MHLQVAVRIKKRKKLEKKNSLFKRNETMSTWPTFPSSWHYFKNNNINTLQVMKVFFSLLSKNLSKLDQLAWIKSKSQGVGFTSIILVEQ